MLWQNFLLAFDSEICSSIKSFDFSQKEKGYSQFFYICERYAFVLPEVAVRISSTKKMFWNFWQFSCWRVSVLKAFLKYSFRLCFSEHLWAIGSVLLRMLNILGTISKCYVFWRPIALLTVLLKINRTEKGSHVKISTNLTRNHL